MVGIIFQLFQEQTKTCSATKEKAPRYMIVCLPHKKKMIACLLVTYVTPRCCAPFFTIRDWAVHYLGIRQMGHGGP